MKLLILLTIASFNFKAKAIEVREPENENETLEPGALTSQENASQPDLQPTGSSIVLTDGKQIEDTLSILPTEFTFPENHKNFSETLGLLDSPILNNLNQYHQQYKEYYSQKNQHSSYAKPIKFDGQAKIPSGLSAFGEEGNQFSHFKKPFPYLFESHLNNNGAAADAQFPEVEDATPATTVFGHSLKHLDIRHGQKEISAKKESPWKKILKVLTTVVPFGILLASLTPNILYVNSTEGQSKPGRLRSLENEDPLTEMISKFGGMEALDDPKCEDRLFCELSRLGQFETSNFIEKGFWFLANETPNDLADEVGMKDLFEAIRGNSCSRYQCEPKNKEIKDESKKPINIKQSKKEGKKPHRK